MLKKRIHRSSKFDSLELYHSSETIDVTMKITLVGMKDGVASERFVYENPYQPNDLLLSFPKDCVDKPYREITDEKVRNLFEEQVRPIKKQSKS